MNLPKAQNLREDGLPGHHHIDGGPFACSPGIRELGCGLEQPSLLEEPRVVPDSDAKDLQVRAGVDLHLDAGYLCWLDGGDA